MRNYWFTPFGYPDSAEWYYKTKSGSVIGNDKQYCNKDVVNDVNWQCESIKYNENTVATGTPGQGVGFKFDIKRASTGNATLHKGYARQYVYVKLDKLNRTINMNSEYGHKRMSGSIGFSVGTSGVGLGITPGSTVDTRKYAHSVSY